MSRLLIFDLDGTLLDTSPGIFHSVRYAERMMGLKPIDETKLRLFVGPPPFEMYKKIYGLNDAEAALTTGFHREYGACEGYKESTPYKGIRELLEKLHLEEGVISTVGTLKKQEIAEKVLKNHHMLELFDMVLGMNEEESYTKTDIIQMIMNQYKSAGEETIVIGDTVYDYEGAKAANTCFIGVSYGFGFPDDSCVEFTLVNNVKELRKLVL